MAIILSEARARERAQLRIEPTAKRVRAEVAGQTLLDTRRALLVWEPKRVVPVYAVPNEDLHATITNDDRAAPVAESIRYPAWDPRVPFAVRLTEGRRVLISVQSDPADVRSVEGFIADDPELAGYVIVDFAGPDRWIEDNDEIISHPHDPFSRIDIRSTDLSLVFAVNEVVIARTRRAKVLYETGLPPRFYIPREDVVVALEPSVTVTSCSYKGTATYYSPMVNGHPVADLAWSYENPLVDAFGVQGDIAFFEEKLDLTVDGVSRPRPFTPWS